MIKTLVLSIPPLDISRPHVAGAILCAVCKKSGHNVSARNLQIELVQWLEQQNLPKNYFDNSFYSFNGSISSTESDVLEKFINTICDQIQQENYNYVLISVFSFLGQKFLDVFVKILRKHTKAKIIIGGSGILNEQKNQGEILLNQGFIDCYIVGEAENSLLDYFSKNHGNGINNSNFVQIENLDQCPWPDYSFYNLEDYDYPLNKKELVIVGSRGCVRKCTFCDVVKYAPKFRYRSGKNIADEIIQHYENYGVTNFYFADSLVNGSLKSFNDLCNALQNYKFDQPIQWKGQYIIRNKKSTPVDHFSMLKSSGCSELFIGIETGSDRIRKLIGKNFTNDDIEFYLENFNQIDVKTLFLFFTGYVDETLDDHQETLKMFKRWQKYVATGTITGIETFNTLAILPDSPLYNIAKESNFHFMENDNKSMNNLFWLNPKNPKLDFIERVRRHVEMIETAIEYKWPIWNGEIALDLYYQFVLEYKNRPLTKLIPIKEFK